MQFNDMRGYIDVLRKENLLHDLDIQLNVARETSELQALMRHLHNDNGPALMLNNLEGYNMPEVPLLFNPYGTRERTAMILGERDPLKAKAKHANVLADQSSWIEPNVMSKEDSPCKQNIISEKNIDLAKQLPHAWFGKEGPSSVSYTHLTLPTILRV